MTSKACLNVVGNDIIGYPSSWIVEVSPLLGTGG